MYASEWMGRSCEQYCQDRSAHEEYDLVCASGPLCNDAIGVGYTRLDACYKEEFEYAQKLTQSCTEPLPESLADSVYFVSCCCARVK